MTSEGEPQGGGGCQSAECAARCAAAAPDGVSAAAAAASLPPNRSSPEVTVDAAAVARGRGLVPVPPVFRFSLSRSQMR